LKHAIRPTLSILILLAATFASATDLNDTEQRGKQIFLSGTSPAGSPITALLGIDRTELPASAAPCASCHGTDGRGRPEGGVVPSNITWSELSKSYGHEHDYGRRHPVFDETSVAVAIVKGTDPAGNRLDVAMPNYRMAQEDVDALIAYLKRLEYELDPGVGERTVQIATLLPLSGPAAAQGEAVRAVLSAFVQQLNTGGGVNGRSIELQVIPLGETPEQTAVNVREALQAREVFALVAIYSQGAETELAELLEEYEVPVIGPVSRAPAGAQQRAPQTFYLYSGNAELVRSLGQFALNEDDAGQRRQVAVGPDNELLDAVSDFVTASLPYANAEFDAAAIASLLSATDDVLFLGTALQLDQILAVLAESPAVPRLFLPAATATPALLNAPQVFNGRIFVGYPTLPGDVSDNGRQSYATLGAQAELPSAHLPSQIAAFAAAKVLVEAMQRSGHTLSRERFIAELEGMHRFATGLTPPISFSLNRRIGALGAHIVRLDLEAGRMVPQTAWQTLD